MAVDEGKLEELILASHRDLDLVKTLLAAAPDLIDGRLEKYNETPLEAASHMGQREIAEYLLAQGATPDICVWAMLGRRKEVAALLADDAALAKARGAHGRISALYHAALGGDVEIARMLVEKGAGEDADGALHAAVKRGDAAMAEFLLDNGAENLELPDFSERTPLKAALENGDEAMAALLRARGAQEPA